MHETLGSRLRRLRSDRGWSIRELAKKLGMANQSVGFWERDKVKPKLRTLERLAELYGVQVGALFVDIELAVKASPPKKQESRFIGERLRSLREKRGMSRKFVADRLSVNEKIIVRAENGEHLIRAWRLPTLARLYHCSTDYILTGHEQPHVAALHRAIGTNAPHSQLLAMVSNYD